ncbi:phosphoribosyltransferase [Arthrobacter sp. I2-34]|uniref:Phosphoribosyltransferase n=1 Tax=Arthrobacter hankyongi TaxID=2904801 RepID=A0ABS9L252_9MICC|nr:phosphoribosyltransferase domain-containing protein [Arthrobacter hankyongi]MCG2620713.1 phosphoribosyltransferase [Arthrobacter hankyongi]
MTITSTGDPAETAVLPWTGGHVESVLEIGVGTDTSGSLFDVRELVGLALRRNPKRAHLLVSRVLGKHRPSDPGLVIAAGELLGVLAAQALDGTLPDGAAAVRQAAGHLSAVLRLAQTRPESPEAAAERARLLHAARGLLAPLRASHPEAATLGYAETATGLGRLVAGAVGSYYIHSTRHSGNGTAAYGAFEEAHSHATSHRLLPADPARLDRARVLVLVDDELSTGATIINTIRELHARSPKEQYVVAALVDLRTDADRARFEALAAELGTVIRTVALARGSVTLPPDVLDRARQQLAALPAANDGAAAGGPATGSTAAATGRVVLLPVAASDLPVGPAALLDRYGSAPAGFGAAARTAAAVGRRVLEALDRLDVQAAADGILVLGTEEYLHLPLALADWLAGEVPAGVPVRFSSTTRSPIVALARPDYAINTVLSFASHDGTIDGPGPRYAYNVHRPGERRGTVVVVPEPGTDPASVTGPGSLAEALGAACDRVLVVQLPGPAGSGTAGPLATRADAEAPAGALPDPLYGPEFGSYAAGEVAWLLKDLSRVQLEAPTAERERAIQAGTAHYAESLPVEYHPSPEYLALFEQALERSAGRVAQAIGVVAEMALAARDGRPVLVSLARAGTPVGILMKRWLRDFHGLDVPHYTMSIVRGRGIDETALRYLAARHDPARVLFVDGWTGKGAISRELQEALERFAAEHGPSFSPELAVLADPGHCTTLFGTRDDYLIPSACLNSTVSGLVSRTVLNADYIGAGDFHGAKFYAELAGSDRSARFLDAVSARFADVRDAAAAEAGQRLAEVPTVDWSGWKAVERIAAEYGIPSPNLVKPGVGETTRVLLRRVPWQVLVNPEATADLGHVLLLAEQRGVTVVEVPGLPYSCVGLIRPEPEGSR